MKVFGTDYDGVIINIEPQKADGLGTLLSKEWGVDKNEVLDFYLKTGGSSRRYKFNYFYKKKFKKPLTDREYGMIEPKFSLLLKNELYTTVKLLPGALELLKYTRKRFNYSFISSGVPMEELRYLVKLNNVEKYFDLILGTNNKYPSKKQHFEKIRLMWKPDKIIYLADSPLDMATAKNANAIPIGVLTNIKKAELMKAGAVKVCEIKQAPLVIEEMLL